jgi:glycosyltransferase involved in cell wall biosynthesis
VDPAGIRLLPIPIDIDLFTPTTDDEWLQHLERPTLAFVGRADDPRKNVALLLDALPLLRRRLPGVRVLLVGTPPRYPLPDGAEALGVVASVADVVRTCALLVVPSRQEGFGVAAAEALACGVPVVSTPSGGPEEMLERSGGGRVLAGFDPAELADTAADLLEQPGRLLEMRAAGRRYIAAEHAPDRFAKRLEGLFTELDADD